MKNETTQGEWYVSGDLKNQVKSNILPHGVLVANINPINAYSEEEAAANAKLVAAAPELLKCAELLLNLCENREKHGYDAQTGYFEYLNHNMTNNQSLIDYAKQAIRKAAQ